MNRRTFLEVAGNSALLLQGAQIANAACEPKIENPDPLLEPRMVAPRTNLPSWWDELWPGLVLGNPKGQHLGGDPCFLILLSVDRERDGEYYWTCAAHFQFRPRKDNETLRGMSVVKLLPEELLGLRRVADLRHCLPRTMT